MYEEILADVLEAKEKKLAKFFEQILFEKCNEDFIRTMIYYTKKRKYCLGQNIYSSGGESNEFYMLYKGQISVILFNKFFDIFHLLKNYF